MVQFILIICILFLSIMIHECAHGLVALYFGDDTAKRQGRLTLNIIKHIDPFGTVILPLFLLIFYVMTGSGILFGWAKPVPVNPGKMRKPARDYMIVSLAGPVSNILMAFGFALIWALSGIMLQGQGVFFSILFLVCLFGVKINIILAMFNLVPIPPLDGSHVLAYFLPHPLSVRYQEVGRYGILIVLLLLITDTLKYPFLFAGYISNTMLQWANFICQYLR